MDGTTVPTSSAQALIVEPDLSSICELMNLKKGSTPMLKSNQEREQPCAMPFKTNVRTQKAASTRPI